MGQLSRMGQFNQNIYRLFKKHSIFIQISLNFPLFFRSISIKFGCFFTQFFFFDPFLPQFFCFWLLLTSKLGGLNARGNFGWSRFAAWSSRRIITGAFFRIDGSGERALTLGCSATLVAQGNGMGRFGRGAGRLLKPHGTPQRFFFLQLCQFFVVTFDFLFGVIDFLRQNSPSVLVLATLQQRFPFHPNGNVLFQLSDELSSCSFTACALPPSIRLTLDLKITTSPMLPHHAFVLQLLSSS